MEVERGMEIEDGSERERGAAWLLCRESCPRGSGVSCHDSPSSTTHRNQSLGLIQIAVPTIRLTFTEIRPPFC